MKMAKSRDVSLADAAQEVLAREVGTIPRSETAAPQAKNLYDRFTPVRGLLTDEDIDRYFGRTPSSSRPVDFE